MSAEDRKLKAAAEQEAILESTRRIGRKIVVLSGKGGVGKSTVAANVAMFLASKGKKAGLLDVDIHGPSIPHILGLSSRRPESDGSLIKPVIMDGNGLKVISMGFMLEDRDTAVIWRGPMKYNVIKQFLKDVSWDDLDYLVVDSPPGTGDEPLSVVQLMGDNTGAVIVATPQDVALNDIRRSITFCRKLELPILGLIENMSGFICPECGHRTDIFKTAGARRLAEETGIRFLGSVPIEPGVVQACDAGEAYMEKYPESETAKAFKGIVERLGEGESRKKKAES
ncbi:MAG: Mrp/NBP35 family ATP-binding protein [Kiritimatiellia bacterium]